MATNPQIVNTATLEDAIALAVQAHRGQKDKAGKAYILHPLRVMMRVTGEHEQMAAVLHDVVEDCGRTLDDLSTLGYPEAGVSALDGLTRRADETYEAFVDRAATNPIARRVKLADLEDNMDLRRLESVGERDMDRLKRYVAAWKRLTQITALVFFLWILPPHAAKGAAVAASRPAVTATTKAGTDPLAGLDNDAIFEKVQQEWPYRKAALDRADKQAWRDSATYTDWLRDVPLGLGQGFFNAVCVPVGIGYNVFSTPNVHDLFFWGDDDYLVPPQHHSMFFWGADSTRTKLGRSVSLAVTVTILLLPVIVPFAGIVRRGRARAGVTRRIRNSSRDREKMLDDAERECVQRAYPDDAERRMWCSTEQYRCSKAKFYKEMQALLDETEREPLTPQAFFDRMRAIGQRHVGVADAGAKL